MDNAQELQLIFQTLGDANRLRIIQFISEKECTVSEIVQASKLSQPLVSHHLRVLRKNHILDSERKGPFVIYRLRNKKLLEALDLFLLIFKDIPIVNENKTMFRCSYGWRQNKKKFREAFEYGLQRKNDGINDGRWLRHGNDG